MNDDIYDSARQNAREFFWRQGVVQRELEAALHHWLRLLCPEEETADHAAWLEVLAARTIECLTPFNDDLHPWYGPHSAPEALSLTVYARPETVGGFRRLIIEHEPTCAGHLGQGPHGPIDLGHCQCYLRVRREA